MLLDGRRLVITGVLNDDSIAFHAARLAQAEGAEIVLTSFGRILSITQRVAKRLPTPVDVLELDVSEPDHHAALASELDRRWGQVDGVLHAIAFAPPAALGGNFLGTAWDDVATAVQVSSYSLKSLAVALAPLMSPGAGIVGLDFDATVAWPGYDWMGVAKAALESCARYLARDLGPKGIRVNLVSAGPLGTVAARGIPGFEKLAELWQSQAPLGWDVEDPSTVAGTICFLLSDYARGITGEIVHVDGGFHAVGAPGG